ncbi:MAG: hypothetical protein V4662_04985 [Verrucomicrobiota bacterium]
MHIPPQKPRRSQLGALMVAALLLMLVTGMFMTSWVSLIGARGVQISHMETAVQRRLSLESSRQFAWQTALEKTFDPGVSLSASTNGLLGAAYGGVGSHDGWTALNIYTSTRTPGAMTTVFPYNYTGMRPMSAYLSTEQLKRPTTLSGVDDFNSYLFLKTYPPVLAGDLFVAYRKPFLAGTQIDINTATADHHAYWHVDGRTVIRDPDSHFSLTTPSPMQLPFTTRSLYIQSHDTYNAHSIYGSANGPGNSVVKLLPSNLPAVPSTTGPVSSTPAVDRFQGYLNVVNNPDNPDNSLYHFMDRERTAGRSDYRTVDVFVVGASGTGEYWMEEQKDPTYKPPMWPSGYPASGLRVLCIKLDSPSLTNMRIHGVVHQVVFKGQSSAAAFDAAGALAPRMFTFLPMGDGGPSVRDIRFEGDNNRRIVIGAKHWNAAPLDITWVGSPVTGDFRWRTVFINEYQTVILNMPASVTQNVRWLGGVMTNWTFKRRAAGGNNRSRLTFAADGSLSTLAAASPSFASVIPRDAWLESYFLPVPPP